MCDVFPTCKMAASGAPRRARSGGRPRLLPMVESAVPPQQLLAAAADARPALAAPPLPALPSPSAAGRVGLAAGQRAVAACGRAACSSASAGGELATAWRVAWLPWPASMGGIMACRLPAYGWGGHGGVWADSPAAMQYLGDSKAGTAGGPAAAADGAENTEPPPQPAAAGVAARAAGGCRLTPPRRGSIRRTSRRGRQKDQRRRPTAASRHRMDKNA